MIFKTFLIKYGEIGIKGKNRYLFEDALVKQIRHALKHVDGEFEARKEQGRIYVDTLSDYEYDEVVEALKRVFGIVGICPVVVTEDEGFEKLAERITNYPEVKSIYLMSGSFDFAVFLEGKTLKEVSMFVSTKLSTLEDVAGTATHFVLKKYKDHGMILIDKHESNSTKVTP